MKKTAQFLSVMLVVSTTAVLTAQTTVDATERYSWGPNAGWLDWHADTTNGAVFEATHLTGSVWSPNVGWIQLGNGPDVGSTYANDDADDYGVNVDATSDANSFLLSGLAWSANTGWISFDLDVSNGAAAQPRIDKGTGLMTGYAWSANAGWISLDGVDTGLTEPLIVESWSLY